MTHKRLRIALVLLVLATGSSMAGPKDQWWTISNSYPKTLAPQYMVKGGFENGHDLFVCRAAINNRVYPGKTWDGLGGCFVSIGNEPLVTPYQVLPTPPIVSDSLAYRWASRTEMITDPSLWYVAVQGGWGSGTPNDSDYHICSRDLSINGAYVGKHPGRQFGRPPYDYCAVTWGGQIYEAPGLDYDILLYLYPN